jgi:endonuclease-3
MTLERSDEILSKLMGKYPDPKIELEYSSPFELLLATILAAQSTDARVNMVTKEFFKKYNTPAKIAKEDIKVVADFIRPTGFFRNKASLLITCCAKLVNDFDGQVPETMEELLQLPGVGRKTANIILGNAFNKPAIAVDTHVKRVANRLDLSSNHNPDKIEEDLTNIIRPEDKTRFSQLLTLHGRYVCRSRYPKCKTCVIAEICNWEGKLETK